MGKRWTTVWTVALFGVSATAFGADHLDGPGVSADPAADITDFYSWMSGDGTKLNLVLNTVPLAGPGATLSDAVQYVFHVHSSGGFATPVGSGTETRIIAQTNAAGELEVWVGDSLYARGERGTEFASKGLRVFSGVRNDPFYFNLEGLFDTQETVKSVAGSLAFDGNGCPALGSAESSLLVGQLSGTQMGSAPASDFFSTLNVVSLVIQVDVKHVNAGGPMLGLWASTHAR